MTNRAYLLDTSALLTLIEDEAGADRVEQLLRTAPVLIPWMCLFEVTYITEQERDVIEAERRYALVKSLPSDPCVGARRSVALHRGTPQSTISSFPRRYHYRCLCAACIRYLGA